jgi:hypothetical protein
MISYCAHTHTCSLFKSGLKKNLGRMGQNFSFQIFDNPEMSQKSFFVNLHRTLLPGDSNRSQALQTTSLLSALSHHGLSLRRLVLGQKLLQHQALPDRSRFSHLPPLLHLQKSSATARTTAAGPPVVVFFSPTVAAHLEAPQSLAQIKQ